MCFHPEVFLKVLTLSLILVTHYSFFAWRTVRRSWTSVSASNQYIFPVYLLLQTAVTWMNWPASWRVRKWLWSLFLWITTMELNTQSPLQPPCWAVYCGGGCYSKLSRDKVEHNSCSTPVLTLVLDHLYSSKPVYYIIYKSVLVQVVRLSLIYSFSCVSLGQVISFKHAVEWDQMTVTQCSESSSSPLTFLFVYSYRLWKPTWHPRTVTGSMPMRWVQTQTPTITEGKSVILHSLCFKSVLFFGRISAKLSFYSEMLSLSSFDVFTSSLFLLCSTARGPYWCLILIWLSTAIWFLDIKKRPVALLLTVNQTPEWRILSDLNRCLVFAGCFMNRSHVILQKHRGKPVLLVGSAAYIVSPGKIFLQ